MSVKDAGTAILALIWLFVLVSEEMESLFLTLILLAKHPRD